MIVTPKFTNNEVSLSAQKVVKLDHYAQKINTDQRVVLLQGPVGPFFKRLQSVLSSHAFDVWRICFHPGDLLFSSAHKRLYFQHGIAEWESWFADFVLAAKVDHIVLFGSERAIHKIARQVAADHGVNVISLEEGYIRPGYITLENEGNNASSPLAGLIQDRNYTLTKTVSTPFNAFGLMSFYAGFYYVTRTVLSMKKQKQLFHRRFSALPDIFYWVRNIYRRFAHAHANEIITKNLMQKHTGQYFIIPLQVPSDAQMQAAAKGWNSVKLISATLSSFARQAPKGSQLVFKIHPLERGHNIDTHLIRNTAKAFNISERVHVIDTGALGPLVAHAAGMITINSTSGLSAIFHGIPLLVVGDAIYANNRLAICARGKPDFDSFWTNGFVAAEPLREGYLGWLKASALKPGDFYASKGIEIACMGVFEKISVQAASKSIQQRVEIS